MPVGPCTISLLGAQPPLWPQLCLPEHGRSTWPLFLTPWPPQLGAKPLKKDSEGWVLLPNNAGIVGRCSDRLSPERLNMLC